MLLHFPRRRTCPPQLLTNELRARFEELGPQDTPDAIVVAHYFLPGTRYDLWAIAYDEDEGCPQFFGLVHHFETELGYVALSELETIRSPLGLPVERDLDWDECRLPELRAVLR